MGMIRRHVDDLIQPQMFIRPALAQAAARCPGSSLPLSDRLSAARASAGWSRPASTSASPRVTSPSDLRNNDGIETDLIGQQVNAEGVTVGYDRLKVEWIGEVQR